MQTYQLSLFTRIASLLGGSALIGSLFVPLWRIELDAPQYPEGLALQIYPHKLGGDVQVVNGLNHYIGMQTLHAENFIEFTVLPYLIGFFAVLVLSVALINRKKFFYVAFAAYVAFGILSMIDFWRWGYNYGHNLDPNAAIKVPGMAYQPPLIGYKKLLNFGAYSIPDWGGWFFLVCGLLLMVSFVVEIGLWQRLTRKKAITSAWLLPLVWLLAACGHYQPEAIRLNKDKCQHCKMSIADGRFATELITSKGRIYKFDDVVCMIGYLKQNPNPAPHSLWIADFAQPDKLVEAHQMHFVLAEQINSPMRGNLAAFAEVKKAQSMADNFKTALLNWKEVLGVSEKSAHHHH